MLETPCFSWGLSQTSSVILSFIIVPNWVEIFPARTVHILLLLAVPFVLGHFWLRSLLQFLPLVHPFPQGFSVFESIVNFFWI